MSEKDKEGDEVGTTGHEWDGIQELNNPLPRWWLIVFYVSIVWAVGYWIFMPAWPGISDYTKGLRGHSDRENVAADILALEESRAIFAKQLSGLSLQKIENNPELLAFALEAGRSAFGDNCATCHGSGAAGSVGYPNLNDDDWLWGGSLEDVRQTLQFGIRSGHDEARMNQMPSFGADELIDRAQISDLVEYVVSVSGRAAESEAVERGAAIFQTQCISCHGAEAKGDPAQGAPDLTDQIWLYGAEREAIYTSIYNSRGGVMPAWGVRLDSFTLDALAIYVHTLGGGE